MKVFALIFAWTLAGVALAEDFSGFWKSSCGDAFGVQIKSAGGDFYSVSFCGPGGCFAPGTWTPNTSIVGDPKYKVESPTQLSIQKSDATGYNTYKKCSDDPTAVAPTPGAPESQSNVRYKPYYENLPDYENLTVFSPGPSETTSRLKHALQTAPTTSDLCARGSVEATVVAPHELKSNICDSDAYSAVADALATLAPSLDRGRITFRKLDLDKDNEPELLVEYVDLIGDEHVKDPYLTLWLISFEGERVKATHVGPFLVGDIWVAIPFGQHDNHNMVVIRHQSCTECHPWVYLTIVDFLRGANGDAFRFTYSEDHKRFGSTLEYILPRMGHSADAHVESRIMKPTGKGPHLIQRFTLDGGKTEWWVFTCKETQCDFELSVGAIPAKYKPFWEAGRKL